MQRFEPFWPSGAVWQFGAVPAQPWPGPETPDLARVQTWRSAITPGQVHSDLLAHGLLEDPFVGENLRQAAWVDACDWWYRTVLDLDLAPNQRAFLTFHGLDAYAAVFLNERPALRVAGMFAPHTIELTSHIRPGKPLALAVRLTGPTGWPQPRYSRWESLLLALERASGAGAVLGPIPERLYHLKAPMQFGWDFAPRLRTVGIWDETTLRASGPAAILDLRPPTPARQDAPPWRCELEVDALAAAAVRIELTIQPANFDGPAWTHSAPRQLKAGRQNLALTLPPLDLAPWQPWERGFPHLYWLQVALFDAGSSLLLDRRRLRFGHRQADWAETAGPGSPRWRLQVNGQPLFVRGANWTPADALPGRLRPPAYARLLQAVRDAGINLLRVWGGGLREKAAFYGLCDELGLLVWQEFPFACLFLARFAHDLAWLDRVEVETQGIVRALRHHPSIVTWCGGNEFGVRRNRRLVQRLARAAAQEDHTRPFLPASPDRGDVHDWAVWHGYAPLRDYQRQTAPFCSEFGLSALPDAASLAQFIVPADQPLLDGPAWRWHGAEAAKLRHYAALAGAPRANLEGLIAATQRAQAAGLQTAVEHLRRRKAVCGGFAFWQFNEPWPAIAWSVLDFYGRPKLAYGRLQRILQPVLICLAYELPVRARPAALSGAVWIVNDTQQPLDGLTWLAWSGGQLAGQGTAAVGADESQPVGVLTVPLTGPADFLRLELRQAGRLLASNEYDLGLVDLPPAPWRLRVRRWLAERLLR